MSYTAFKRSIALIIVALITLVWTMSNQAEAQSKAPGEQSQLDQQFHKAHEDFLRKDFKGAASEIHQGAESLDFAVSGSTGQEEPSNGLVPLATSLPHRGEGFVARVQLKLIRRDGVEPWL